MNEEESKAEIERLKKVIKSVHATAHNFDWGFYDSNNTPEGRIYKITLRDGGSERK